MMISCVICSARLMGSASKRNRGSGDHEFAFSRVLDRLNTGGNPLLCSVCGYRFRLKDIGKERLKVVQEKGFSLERNLFPGRANDPFKPLIRGSSNQSTTVLTLDHLVPEELFGWSEEENLAVVCGFCNFGKLASRRPLESLTTFAVGALSEIPRGREFTFLKQQIIVAALRSHGGLCYNCRRIKEEVELTVRPVTRDSDGALQGFAPWNLRSICYICLNDEQDELDANPTELDLVTEYVRDSSE